MILRRALIAAVLVVVGVCAAALIEVVTAQVAEGDCYARAPREASGWTQQWEWNEVAYVCRYRDDKGRMIGRERVGLLGIF